MKVHEYPPFHTGQYLIDEDGDRVKILGTNNEGVQVAMCKTVRGTVCKDDNWNWTITWDELSVVKRKDEV